MADMLQRAGRGGVFNSQDLEEPAVERQTELTLTGRAKGHDLDSAESRKLHARLMSWYLYERDRQAANRLEMALDHDFYDGDQWSEDDKAILEERNQTPLVYNEVAPMCDWMIGTERRARVDWKILPRSDDDVEMADVKTKVMKYVSDVNQSAFQRSRAFGDAVKGGLGWVDDGIRDDPTKDPIYSAYEDWRNVVMDSSGLNLVGEDARFVFRWRHVDDDIAAMMFPDRKDVVRRATEDWALGTNTEDDDLLSETSPNDATLRSGTSSMLGGTTSADALRKRVRLIECQWREPVATKFIMDGPLAGQVYDPRDTAMAEAMKTAATQGHQCSIIDKVVMRVHTAVMTDFALLHKGVSIYRHNQFSLTPISCYRRGRDRQWYGPVRRVRSIQQDLNKRASKALWYLNANQLIADNNAFDDVEQAREEAQDPNGVILHKPGAEVNLRRDTDAATGQMQIMALGQQAIQRSAGVTDENLGRKTNAVSGEAIKARQLQGSVVTTEPFDNLRMSVHAQGTKVLSLIEQFYSQEKVIRLTGAQGELEWVKINQPEVQPDGTVRWVNDVTSSIADFVVDQADYAGSLRQVMFEQLSQISQRLPPEVALRLLRMAFEYSDLPNKREIADEIRRLTGDQDPNKKLTPEEQAAAEQRQAEQAEAAQLQRDMAHAQLEEVRARVFEINARGEKLQAEAAAAGAGQDGEMQSRIDAAVGQVRQEAATQIDTLTQQLAKVGASNEAAIMKINKDADTASEVARINANSKERIAEAARPAEEALTKLEERLAMLESASDTVKPKAKPKA